MGCRPVIQMIKRFLSNVGIRGYDGIIWTIKGLPGGDVLGVSSVGLL